MYNKGRGEEVVVHNFARMDSLLLGSDCVVCVQVTWSVFSLDSDCLVIQLRHESKSGSILPRNDYYVL